MSRGILHILHSLNPATGGPAEAVRQICFAHRDAGDAAEIVTLDAPGAPFFEGWPVPIHAMAGRGKIGWTPQLGRWLGQHARDFTGVYVHGLWQWQGAGSWFALRGGRPPYFVFPHGMLDPWFRDAHPWKHLRKALYWQALEKRVLRDAAAVVFTCEEERQLGRETFHPWTARREEIVSLGTVAPPAPAADLKERFFVRHPELRGQRLLLFLGRLHVKKGCDLLLQAFRQVRPAQHLVLAGPCGDPSLEAALRAQAQGLPATFTGPLYDLDKWAALAAADAFILPSHQENFGIAVAEALASGLPTLISQKVNIWREIVADGAGFAEPDTVEGTARLLEQWQKADSAAMRSSASRCFSTRFDIRCTAAALVKLAHEKPD